MPHKNHFIQLLKASQNRVLALNGRISCSTQLSYTSVVYMGLLS